MTEILFFDVETTGMPDWKVPSGSEHQPHIVQLAAILANEETQRVISTLDVIVKPEGWVIPADMTEIHGVTQELALRVGVPEKLAVYMLFELWGKRKRVAHNRTFDQRIIRIAGKRYFSESNVNDWADKENFECTMLMSKPIVKAPQLKRKGYKNPKLEEAYEFFTGEKLVGAHNAMNDARACAEIYWAMSKE